MKLIKFILILTLLVYLLKNIFEKENYTNKKINKNLALTTCNNVKNYYQWIPYIIPFWHFLDFDIIIYFYGDEIPKCLNKYKKYIILVKPPKNLYIPSVCQISRLFLPILHKNYDKVLITDVDLIPISKKYFKKINSISNDKFIFMRKKKGEYFMGFNAANCKLWSKLTNLNENITINEINKHLILLFDKYKKNNSLPIKVKWGLDQILLKKYRSELNKKYLVVWTNLNNYLLLDTNWMVYKVYFGGKKYNISKTHIKNNLENENIIFFTRDNERKCKNLDKKILILQEIMKENVKI